MEKMFNEGNQVHNFMSSSGSGTVINYGSGSSSDFSTSYGPGSVPVKKICFIPPSKNVKTSLTLGSELSSLLLVTSQRQSNPNFIFKSCSLADSAPHPLYTIYITKCPQKCTKQNAILSICRLSVCLPVA